jgi:hypothetical protein
MAVAAISGGDMNRFQHLRFSFFVSILSLFCTLSSPAGAQSVNVTTWQDNPHRTGEYVHESSLLYNTLSDLTFGQLCSSQLDGQVYAQPLVLAGVSFNGSRAQTVVYVVTQNDTVYAISGASTNTSSPCTVLGSVSLSGYLSQYPVDCKHIGAGGCLTIAPYVGILGTPVINAGTLYVVAETQDVQTGQPNNWYHTLFAINTSSLAINSHVQIAPPSGCLFGSQPFSLTHIQRPGLLYATAGSTNYVYIAFSMMDGNSPLPNGMVLGYDTANFSSTPLCFATTPGPGVPVNSGGGGIWQGGAGLAEGSDGTGNYIYFNTGNGVWDGTSNFGDSFVKLNPSTLAESDYFTPSDQYYRNCVNTSGNNIDLDFGSGGVLLVPDQKLSNAPYLAISGDKEGDLWVMNRNGPGKWNQGTCSISGSCLACTAVNGQAPNNKNVQTLQVLTGTHNAVFHNTPAFATFNVGGTTITNYIYAAAIGGHLTQYQLCNSATAPLCGTPVATNTGFKYGVTPAVSSNSTNTTATDGILWAIWNDGSYESLSTAKNGVLYAYDALSMAHLYDSSQCSTGVDKIDPATKFSVPTIANGYVYLGTMGPIGGISGSYNNGAFYIFTTVSRTSC